MYGLPIWVRDAGFKDDMPKSGVNKDYYTQNVERELSNSGRTRPVGMLGKATSTSNMLLKLARTTPTTKGIDLTFALSGRKGNVGEERSVHTDMGSQQVQVIPLLIRTFKTHIMESMTLWQISF